MGKARKYPPAIDRFNSRVTIDGHSGCWDWIAGTNKFGYGTLRNDEGRMTYAHRLSFETFRGEIPCGMVLHHLCGVRSCVNPWHLQPVPPTVNLMFRGWRACVTGWDKADVLEYDA